MAVRQADRGHHLTRCGRVWHYQRRRPKAFEDIEPRRRIRFSLGTSDFSEAKLLAAQHTVALDRRWRLAKQRGVSLVAEDSVARHRAAVDTVSEMGFDYASAAQIPDEELLSRLRTLFAGDYTRPVQKAGLGLIPEPELKLAQGFDRFWGHIRDEWSTLSKDQRRVKRNIYLKSIRNFEALVGVVPFGQITRKQAFAFRGWWMKRIEKEGLKPNTGNRELDALRRLITVNFDIDSVEKPNPFARIRLKDSKKQTRLPFETAFIETNLLAPGALAPLPEPLQLLVRLLVNTGMRPSEAIGLELADIQVEADIPHVYVRKNKTRSLKTDHSERMLPLVGVSLDAARRAVAMGGWGKWAGKNMYATTLINRHFRESNLVPDRKRSLYSLRHWFQDQLTKRDVVDRAQAQLMGHKFQRPKYGLGKDLSELRAIIEPFAIR